jgi:hypothetical protein
VAVSPDLTATFAAGACVAVALACAVLVALGLMAGEVAGRDVAAMPAGAVDLAPVAARAPREPRVRRPRAAEAGAAGAPASAAAPVEPAGTGVRVTPIIGGGPRAPVPSAAPAPPPPSPPPYVPPAPRGPADAVRAGADALAPTPVAGPVVAATGHAVADLADPLVP